MSSLLPTHALLHLPLATALGTSPPQGSLHRLPWDQVPQRKRAPHWPPQAARERPASVCTDGSRDVTPHGTLAHACAHDTRASGLCPLGRRGALWHRARPARRSITSSTPPHKEDAGLRQEAAESRAGAGLADGEVKDGPGASRSRRARTCASGAGGAGSRSGHRGQRERLPLATSGTIGS